MTLVWDQHLIYFEDALAKHKRGDFEGAIQSWQCALAERDDPLAHWNLAQALLSTGRYLEGFNHYAVRWKVWPQMLNPGCLEIQARIPTWQGENIVGKRLVILGEQGFGDVIMAARYIPVLQSMGIEVALAVPSALHRLLEPLAPIDSKGDICCPIYDVLLYLQHDMKQIPSTPYLKVDQELRNHWSIELPFNGAKTIGIAWKTGPHDNEFNRIIPLEEFVSLLNMPDATLYALHPNDREQAIKFGVVVPEYDDFADVAAVASLMDMIVCADVAAIHVAGAIGHLNSYVMLPYLSSWRWISGNVWYPDVKLCRQTSPGDWASAFSQLEELQ
jgi:hypothetical protein